MTERPSYLGITQTHIDKTDERVFPFSDDLERLRDFMRETLLECKVEQPILYGNITQQRPGIYIPDAFSFGLGSSLTYDMLPQHERELPLTEDEVAASHRSILEQRETADPESPLDLRWYFKALQKDSPDFYDWVAQQTQSFTDSDVQVSFLVGVTRVSLPFYMRAEAKKLRERFSGV